MVVQMGGGTSNFMRALQQQIAQKEYEKQQKLGNIQAGVGGFADAQAVGAMQDNIAALAQQPVAQPYGNAQGDIAPPTSALSKLDTGGFFGRLYGGLQGVGAYRQQIQPGMELALLQDRNARQDFTRGQEWQREDQMRMEELARQAQERRAVANAYGLGEVDPNVPESAFDNLVRMREMRDREKQAQRERQAAALTIDGQTYYPDDPLYDFARKRAGQDAFPEPVEPQETPEERIARIEAEAAARARGTASGAPPKVEETPEERIARIEAESAARARGSASVQTPKPFSPNFGQSQRWQVLEGDVRRAQGDVDKLGNLSRMDPNSEEFRNAAMLSGYNPKDIAVTFQRAQDQLYAAKLKLNAAAKMHGFEVPYPEVE